MIKSLFEKWRVSRLERQTMDRDENMDIDASEQIQTSPEDPRKQSGAEAQPRKRTRLSLQNEETKTKDVTDFASSCKTVGKNKGKVSIPVEDVTLIASTTKATQKNKRKVTKSGAVNTKKGKAATKNEDAKRVGTNISAVKMGKGKHQLQGDKTKTRSKHDITNEVVEGEERVLLMKKSSEHPSLHTRTTPAAFYDALVRLNDVQRDAVREMGFGHILSLQVKGLPGKLAYWVVDSFDGRSCELNVKDNLRIKVTVDDVYRVFGFPRGTQKIVSFRSSSNNDLMDQWINLFGVDDRKKIKITLLLEHMVDGTDGGTWFRRNFLIAMAFSLIESLPNGTVQPYILPCLEDLGSLNNWDWGEYVLRTLVTQKRNWLKNSKTTFSGPPLLLILLYVDRIEVHMVREPRLFPLIVNWTSATNATNVFTI